MLTRTRVWKFLVVWPIAVSLASNAFAASDRDICEAPGTKAIAACTRLLSSGTLSAPDQATIYFLRGAAYRRKDDFDRAIADLSQAINLLEKGGSREATASIYVVRAGTYSQKGDSERALEDYRAALVADPKNERAAAGVVQIEAALAAPNSPPAPTPAPPVDRDSIHGWSAEFKIEFAAIGGQSWCQADVSILLIAERATSFQPESVAFQRMIGRIRGAVQAECSVVQTISFEGRVNGEVVYASETSSFGNWRQVVLDPNTRKPIKGTEGELQGKQKQ